MRTRALGKTGITVTELALGTWGLSGDAYGPIPPIEPSLVVERALAVGINLIETSASYQMGKIETTIGEVLAGREAVVVSRWGTDRKSNPPRKRFDADYLKESAEESRKRLGDNTTIIGMLHNPSSKAMQEGSCTETLRQLAQDGVIQSWGVSVGDEEVARAALDEEAPVVSFAHNILVVQPLRSLESALKDKQTGVLAHSVLFYGLLTGRWGHNKTFRSIDHRSERWPDGTLNARIRHLDAIRPLVSGDVRSMRSAAVRFVLENETVSSVVLGPRTSVQLDQLIRECNTEPPYLSEGKLHALEARLKDLDVPR